MTALHATPLWGPDFDVRTQQDPEIAGVVLDELARPRGGRRALVLVARAPADPRP